MKNTILEGFKFGFGIFLFFGIIFGIAFAVGFHTADEILGGNFSGNFIFENNVTFQGNVNGINSGLPEMKIYNTSGTYTWNIPNGINKVRIQVAGAGGGGGAGGAGSDVGGTGGTSSVESTNVNIQANGGLGGEDGGTTTSRNFRLNSDSSYSGSNVLIIGQLDGKGGSGGLGGTRSDGAGNNGQKGYNGGLIYTYINTSSISQLNITVGSGGTPGDHPTHPWNGGKGADGYVIIEY